MFDFLAFLNKDLWLKYIWIKIIQKSVKWLLILSIPFFLWDTVKNSREVDRQVAAYKEMAPHYPDHLGDPEGRRTIGEYVAHRMRTDGNWYLNGNTHISADGRYEVTADTFGVKIKFNGLDVSGETNIREQKDIQRVASIITGRKANADLERKLREERQHQTLLEQNDQWAVR